MTSRDPLALTLEVLRDWRTLLAAVLLLIVIPTFALVIGGR